MIRGGKRERRGCVECVQIACFSPRRRGGKGVWVCSVGGGVSERLEHEK